MFVILVYDTATERNPHVLKTCRKYLRWTQRSVFQGELTPAQYRALTTTLNNTIDPEHDSITTYTTHTPKNIATHTLGRPLANTGDIL